MASCHQATCHYLNQCWPHLCYIHGLIELTYWGRDKMPDILQTTFSNAFSSMKMLEPLLKFHWNLFPGVQLTISHHWFRYGLVPVRRQAIIWTNDGLVHWRIYASLGLNELIAKWQSIVQCTSNGLATEIGHCCIKPLICEIQGNLSRKTTSQSGLRYEVVSHEGYK